MMNEIEFSGSFLAWLLIVASIGFYEIHLLFSYANSELNLFELLLSRVDRINDVAEIENFTIRLPLGKVSIIRFLKENNSTLRIVSPFGNEIKLDIRSNFEVITNGSEVFARISKK